MRELSKCMTKPNKESQNQLLRVLRYLSVKRNYGIKLKLNKNIDEKVVIKCYVDSDWGGDTESRKSISGWIIMFNGIPIVWGSKQQSIVELSSSEA